MEPKSRWTVSERLFRRSLTQKFFLSLLMPSGQLTLFMITNEDEFFFSLAKTKILVEDTVLGDGIKNSIGFSSAVAEAATASSERII